MAIERVVSLSLCVVPVASAWLPVTRFQGFFFFFSFFFFAVPGSTPSIMWRCGAEATIGRKYWKERLFNQTSQTSDSHSSY